METTSEAVDSGSSLPIAAGLAALWAVLAISRPGVTYHLAPLIVAAIPLLGAGFAANGVSPAPSRLAFAGGAMALGVTLLLSTIGSLTGPSLLPFGGAAAEAAIFAIVGAFGGWVFTRGLRHRRR